MASTSTNKQPLLVDHILHEIVDLNDSLIGSRNVEGTNSAKLVLNAIGTDGAIIEDLYVISRSATNAYSVYLYLSSSSDYLRQNEGVYIGSLASDGTTIDTVTSWALAPKILAPNPRVGTNQAYRALYVPQGKSLWAAIYGTAALTDGPLLGVQGGWY